MEQNKARRAGGPKYLSFELVQEEYCIDIKRVREILGMPSITQVPQTPDYIRGVMNLRGSIIPVIDLRLKFGLPFMEYGNRTCIVVVTIPLPGAAMLMGIVVDTIHEVVPIPDDAITRLPYINSRIKSEYLHGFTESDQKFRIILDIDKVLSDKELGTMTAMVAADGAKGAEHE